MKYLIVSGSARPESEAIRISAWLERQFADTDETVVLDLSRVFVPFDTSELWDEGSSATHEFAPVKHYLDWCDAIIVVTPEWDGMAPGKLISFLQAAAEVKDFALAHKPGLIVGESNARGGAYPMVMIRAYSGKNTHINWIPEHLLVRFNGDMFKDTPDNKDDIYIQKRARYCVDMLRRYTEVLAPVRGRLLEDIEQYKSGM